MERPTRTLAAGDTACRRAHTRNARTDFPAACAAISVVTTRGDDEFMAVLALL
ncbi:MAG: hypothetical protein KBF43_08950 [Dermatophilaceae bacterium]|nr:hypothetical protein [Dermatophilaceae bacterium]